MRVLMLGWEFPPHLSGGIGTACEGLTRALAQAGVDVTFVLPEHAGGVDSGGGSVLTTARPSGDETSADAAPAPEAPNSASSSAPTSASRAPSVWVADDDLAQAGASARVRPGLGFGQGAGAPAEGAVPAGSDDEGAGSFRVERVAAWLPGAYAAAVPRAESPGTVAGTAGGRLWGSALEATPSDASAGGGSEAGSDGFGANRGGASGIDNGPRAGLHGSEILRQTRRYADACTELARRLTREAQARHAPGFDAVHAHDWTTFPAGAAVAEALGIPLIVHVHATEFDRSGEVGAPSGDPIRRIEQEGFARAARVLAVSRRTRTVLESRYGVDPSRIRVIYNAASPGSPVSPAGSPAAAAPAPELAAPAAASAAAAAFTAAIKPEDRVVLFLGRLTAQKGPGYFLEAARAVIEKRPDTMFVVAGSGDRLAESIQRVEDAGIADRFVFTGFLRGADVQAVFDRADVYVMPSVSEPFGIAPLEAIQRGVPVIISRQSGVSEVLDHALKVDFWDTEELANQILAILNHPTLGDTLRAHASVQVRGLTWAGAAERVVEAYREALGG